jgi:hypothetical protein
MGTWDDATKQAPKPDCPFCGEGRNIEPIKGGYLCNVCSQTWPAHPGGPG